MFTDAILSVGGFEISVAPSITFDVFTETIFTALNMNLDDVEDKLKLQKLAADFEFPIDAEITFFVRSPSPREEPSANIVILDDNTLRHALTNIYENGWANQIEMRLDKTHERANGVPLPAHAEDDSETAVSIGADENSAVNETPMDEHLSDHEMDSAKEKDRKVGPESVAEVTRRVSEMILRQNLENSHPV